jgi:hypothetical protein
MRQAIAITVCIILGVLAVYALHQHEQESIHKRISNVVDEVYEGYHHRAIARGFAEIDMDGNLVWLNEDVRFVIYGKKDEN